MHVVQRVEDDMRERTKFFLLIFGFNVIGIYYYFKFYRKLPCAAKGLISFRKKEK